MQESSYSFENKSPIDVCALLYPGPREKILFWPETPAEPYLRILWLAKICFKVLTNFNNIMLILFITWSFRLANWLNLTEQWVAPFIAIV